MIDESVTLQEGDSGNLVHEGDSGNLAQEGDSGNIVEGGELGDDKLIQGDGPNILVQGEGDIETDEGGQGIILSQMSNYSDASNVALRGSDTDII